jgi:hypothetical protein
MEQVRMDTARALQEYRDSALPPFQALPSGNLTCCLSFHGSLLDAWAVTSSLLCSCPTPAGMRARS